jgi:hypothetical protein
MRKRESERVCEIGVQSVDPPRSCLQSSNPSAGGPGDRKSYKRRADGKQTKDEKSEFPNGKSRTETLWMNVCNTDESLNPDFMDGSDFDDRMAVVRSAEIDGPDFAPPGLAILAVHRRIYMLQFRTRLSHCFIVLCESFRLSSLCVWRECFVPRGFVSSASVCKVRVVVYCAYVSLSCASVCVFLGSFLPACQLSLGSSCARVCLCVFPIVKVFLRVSPRSLCDLGVGRVR